MVMHLIGFTTAVGVLVALVANICADEHMLENTSDGRLFGVIPWSLVGILGYLLIAASYAFPALQNALIGAAAVTTAWLIVKAYRIYDRSAVWCDVCPVAWGVNGILLVLTFFR